MLFAPMHDTPPFEVLKSMMISVFFFFFGGEGGKPPMIMGLMIYGRVLGRAMMIECGWNCETKRVWTMFSLLKFSMGG